MTSVQKMSSPNPEVSAQLAMVGDIVTITEFKKNKSKSTQASIMMGNNTTIIDAEAKKMLMLLDNPSMGKTYTLTDIKADEKDLESFDITKGENTKEVLGYTCQEYVVKTTQQGVPMQMTIYTTEKVKAQNQQMQSMGSKLKGYPMYLKIEVSQMGQDMIIESEVTKIEAKSIDDATFALDIPEGYTEMKKPMAGQ